jgi:hypothetical protein
LLKRTSGNLSADFSNHIMADEAEAPAAAPAPAPAPAPAAAAAAKPAAAPAASKTNFTCTQFAVVVCRHPNGKFLAVKKPGKGWWMPGGFVETSENFFRAAHSKTLMETGLSIKLEGILRVEYTPTSETHVRLRIVFLASPNDPNAEIKPQVNSPNPY